MPSFEDGLQTYGYKAKVKLHFLRHLGIQSDKIVEKQNQYRHF